MQRKLRSGIWLILFLLVLFVAGSAPAPISIVGYWRMGEDDRGAVAGSAPSAAVDTIGTNSLLYTGTGAAYSTDISSPAAVHTGSTLSVNLTNACYALSNVVSSAVDNFGIELWVKPASVTNSQVLAYNGGTGGPGASGWGLIITNSNYSALLGGVAVIGAAPAIPGVWTHVALVRSNGTSTLFVNGAASGAAPQAPITPSGKFGLGAPPQDPSSQYFNGLIDEVRVFTFQSFRFSTNDLLLNQPNVTLGFSSIVVGPSPAAESLRVITSNQTNIWTAWSDTGWLHPAFGGYGTSITYFNFDTNAGEARTGKLTIASKPFTVTQAAAGYVQAPPLDVVKTGLYGPTSVAVDPAGNLYIANLNASSVLKWEAASQSLSAAVPYGVYFPRAIALDNQGNIYVANTTNLVEWITASNSLVTLIPSGLNAPYGLAVDASNNVYVADTAVGIIRKWSSSTRSASVLVSYGLGYPYGLAMDDVANRLYIASQNQGVIYQLTLTNQATPTAWESDLSPYGLATDAAGTVFFTESPRFVWRFNNVVGFPAVATNLDSMAGIAVDSSGNVYVAEPSHNLIKEIPRAFVDRSPRFETGSAGTNSLSPLVPSTQSLAGVYQPTSDSSWLAVIGATNGVVTYSFTANTTGASRAGHLTVLGVPIIVTQSALIVTPPQITGVELLGNSALQFSFTNAPGASFIVLSSTNVTSPIADWTVLGPASNLGGGNFQFTAPAPTNSPQMFYRVRYP
jgi:Concanavalin A-like lectin/glucanases superfamily/Putative binding domain, N-terminal